MIIRCLLRDGVLDISAQEPYQGDFPEMMPFRKSMRYGDVLRIQDEYRNLKNIDTAINCGFLEVLSYDSSDGSLVVNAELDDIIASGRAVFNAIPLETPDGSQLEFTLPGSSKYAAGKIQVILNGQVLSEKNYNETAARTSITFNAGCAPRTGDTIRFHYVEDTS